MCGCALRTGLGKPFMARRGGEGKFREFQRLRKIGMEVTSVSCSSHRFNNFKFNIAIYTNTIEPQWKDAMNRAAVLSKYENMVTLREAAHENVNKDTGQLLVTVYPLNTQI
jgi:hypothetical protein